MSDTAPDERTPLQVLIVEDRAADAELMVAELRKAGFDPDWRRVETEQAFETHFNPSLDVVLTDLKMPLLDAFRVLAHVRKSRSTVPLIIVSGTIADENAVECLKLGATDYILKDRLARLGPAVHRAIRERLTHVAKREAEAAMHRSEERMRGILATVRDVVWSLSLTDWKILYMSPAGERMFGRPVSDFYENGQLWLEAVHPEDRQRMISVQQEMIRWGTGEAEFRIMRSDGEVRHVQTRAWCAYVDGKPYRLEGINTDITERVEAEGRRHELEAAQLQTSLLVEQNAFKSQFLNMVAHDLNNVVTPMRLSLHPLKDAVARNALPQHSQEVAMIDRGMKRLLAFLADLLDAARLQSGQLAILPKVIDLVPQVAVAIEMAGLQAAEKEIRLEARLPPTPLKAPVDDGRLDQVLGNLLSNALKFTPEGGSVTVSLAEDGPDARIDVADTGVGVDKKDLGLLFKPFSRIGGPGQGKHTGTGLGLFVSRGIVEAHGGRLEVSSLGTGKGATFSIWLPRGEASATHQAKRGMRPARASPRRSEPRPREPSSPPFAQD